MINFLSYAAAKYYAGEPIISDIEFDSLAKLYGFEKIGNFIDLSKAVKHTYPMYSLKKCFVGEDLISLPDEVIQTPKLDGAAISILYLKGELVLALTRGDGNAGLDITEKVKLLVPNIIDQNIQLLQITGEVVAPKDIENARNYAAGALNLKNIEEFKTRSLNFIAYGLQPSLFNTWTEDMSFLSTYNNFETVCFTQLDLQLFPQDGKVFRVNDNSLFEELGYTSNHPRGAFALKEIQKGVVTKLIDVVWQVGRTGVVSPVAILEPIKIGDATVSRATLHNIKYIEELSLEIGCNVEIIRSGEIIPRVTRRVD